MDLNSNGKWLPNILEIHRNPKHFCFFWNPTTMVFKPSDLTYHGLRTPREEIAFTARPKIHSHSQIFRYGRSIFCLPHRPNFSDIFDLCLHWLSVVREHAYSRMQNAPNICSFFLPLFWVQLSNLFHCWFMNKSSSFGPLWAGWLPLVANAGAVRLAIAGWKPRLAT